MKFEIRNPVVVVLFPSENEAIKRSTVQARTIKVTQRARPRHPERQVAYRSSADNKEREKTNNPALIARVGVACSCSRQTKLYHLRTALYGLLGCREQNLPFTFFVS